MADRYRILDRIGRGGMGIVYRVEDLVEKEIRALKVLPRAAGRSNLRGEFLALSRLRHENIVRVFDYGRTAEGDDWFTMELVRGGPLRAALLPAPSDPAFYKLIGGAMRALAFLHARGMVHADVKPSNVLVEEELVATDPAHAAKLVDFGLAAATADPASAAARGTFPYAAPEVYAGRLDARSDLYAIGVLLYELVTGQRPFGEGDVAAVIRRQRQGAPADPRGLRADVPADLAELILALTDPEPGARPQTADEVLQRINEIAGTDFAVNAEPPNVDLTGALVGRDRDLATLQVLWEKAAAGRGAVALVGGEEGIGKTRLLGELKLRVQLAGGRYLGASAAPRPESPFGGLVDVLRAATLELDKAQPATRAGQPPLRRALLAPLLDERAAGSAPGADSLPQESRFALAEAFAGQLLDSAAADGLVVGVDDLHAAEPGTIELFTYLARAVASGRILLVGAGRGDTSDPQSALSTIAAALEHAPHLEQLRLPPLDRAAVRTLVATVFGAETAEALAGELHRASGGNPAFLERTLGALVESGVLARRRGAWVLLQQHPSIPIARDAVAAAVARAEVLPLPARRLLQAAAVLGERFDFETLARATSGPLTAAQLSEALGAARSARILEPELGTDLIVFTHAGLRDALYRAVPEDERLRLHRLAADALISRATAGHRVPIGAMAEHWLALGEKARARDAALAAGDERLSAGDRHGALKWYVIAEPLVRDDPRAAAAHAERTGDVRGAVGDHAGACEDYRRALDRLVEPHAQVRVSRKLAELLRQAGHGDEAIDRLMRALNQARQIRSTSEEAWCQYALARVRMYRGEYAAAGEHASAGLALARAVNSRTLAALLSKTRADVELFRGDAKTALAHVEAALAEAASGADETVIADVWHTRGRGAIHAGDYVRAIDSLERALSMYVRQGRVEQEAKALNNLGVVLYLQGLWDRALTSWERYLALAERMNDVQEIPLALNNLGALYRDRGDFPAALAALERGYALAQRVGRVHAGGLSLGNRGEVLFRQGNLADARECYEACLKLFEPLGAREDLVETRRRLCELDLAGSRVEAALDRAIDTAREAQAVGARLEEAALHRIAASALRQQGDLDSAVWFLERAREIATRLGAGYELGKVDHEAGELAVARGRLEEADAHLARAVETFARLGARWDLARARERRRELKTSAADHSVGPRGGLEVLLDVARASGRMELEKLLEVVIDKILEVTRFERGFVLLLDERGRPTERMRRTRNTSLSFDRLHSDFSGSIVRRVAQTGEPVAIIDVADDAAVRDQQSVVTLGLRSVMCVPMRLKGRTAGIVYVDSRHLSEEDHTGDLALLEALAAQSAVAIENARLVAEEQRKTELMAILAHEIRNPLAGILGFSELVPEETAEMPAKYVQLMSRIHSDAQRLKRLVDNVLELARVEAGKVEWATTPITVRDLLGDCANAFEAVAGKKKIDLVVDAAPSLPQALGNADRLFQVLSNLVSNALKFTPEGGTITLAARTEVLSPVPDRIGSAADDFDAWLPLTAADAPRTFVRIEVRDTGPGIEAAQRSGLFEKFAQGEGGKRSSRGVGLGLYISREIVRRHGGTIWVDSDLGKGSCFAFRIPAVA